MVFYRQSYGSLIIYILQVIDIVKGLESIVVILYLKLRHAGSIAMQLHVIEVIIYQVDRHR